MPSPRLAARPPTRPALASITLWLVLALALLADACGSGERPELTEADRLTSTAAPSAVIEVTDDGDGAVTDPAEPPEGEEPVSATGASAVASAGGGGVPLVVLDTDLGPDIDDVLALAMLHGYEDRGMIEIAAVTVSRNSARAARLADGLNAYWGRPDIPVGIDRASPYAFDDATSYVALADRWPSDLPDRVPDAVPVLRSVLAGAEAQGREVRILQVGFSGNLAALLASGPDDVSPLAGTELVEASGATLSAMAGSIDHTRIEFNVLGDVEAFRSLIAGWPTDLVLSPWELGGNVLYPYTAIRDRLRPDHPVRATYEDEDLDWHRDAPPFYDMRSWDLTSVLVGVEPEVDWFAVSEPGTITVDAEGRTGFRADGGRHRYLVHTGTDDGQRRRAVDRMVELIDPA